MEGKTTQNTTKSSDVTENKPSPKYLFTNQFVLSGKKRRKEKERKKKNFLEFSFLLLHLSPSLSLFQWIHENCNKSGFVRNDFVRNDKERRTPFPRPILILPPARCHHWPRSHQRNGFPSPHRQNRSSPRRPLLPMPPSGVPPPRMMRGTLSPPITLLPPPPLPEERMGRMNFRMNRTPPLVPSSPRGLPPPPAPTTPPPSQLMGGPMITPRPVTRRRGRKWQRRQKPAVWPGMPASQGDLRAPPSAPAS